MDCNYEDATAAPAEDAYQMDDETMALMESVSTASYDSTLTDNADDVMPTTGADNGLKLADLTGKAYDDEDWDKLLDELSIEDMVNLINVGGWQTVELLLLEK